MTKAVKHDTCVLYLMHAIRVKHAPQQPPKKRRLKSQTNNAGAKKRVDVASGLLRISRAVFAPSSFLLVQDPFPLGFTQFSDRQCFEVDIS